MTTSNVIIKGALLHDGHREAGTMEDGKNKFSWAAGYVVTLLPYGSKRATEIQKYYVRSDPEATIEALLADVEWGTIISIETENGFIIGIQVD